MSLRKVRKLCALALAVALVGCGLFGLSETKIADLKGNPSAYSGRDIRIHGTVTNAIKLPFVSTRLYSVRDETGEINVVTEGAVPSPGADVDVVGTLDTIATIGTQSIGIHLREKQK